ncbi:ParB/RepB/Spo0J family partition protein [Labedaea rhizosphaerae]|uniref:ParB-like chromosome segregation protein Spo0J n=1 Tax=Labedaea rhizosphaerae TaxID=598644 RepID=A0A4R6SHH8_LABRH|nr:ParB N-terminal domain-containing protein [Labedaea rhizosphaerae]TDQ00309.1 ParB-like chromosome segregation protein Spo0J [Labedaea rhizosphaerae]
MSTRGSLPDVELVSIESLVPGDSPRLEGVDEEHCRRLAEMDSTVPPILVHRQTMRVIDGMHRLRAAQLSGADTIRVRFFEGDEQEAFIWAVKENIAHGLPLTLADRTAAAHRIIDAFPHLSDRAIAGYVGLSDKTVSSVRNRRSTPEDPQLSSRLGADGRVRPLNRETGRRRAAEILRERPEASLREIAASAGISVGTAHDVRKRIRNGESPLLTQQRSGNHRPAPRMHSSNNGVERPCQDGKRKARETVPAEQIDLSILHNLTRDPALRHSESGRELLRFLHAYLVRGGWAEHVRAVPPHCTDSVSKLARQCAQLWLRFAADVENLNL